MRSLLGPDVSVVPTPDWPDGPGQDPSKRFWQVCNILRTLQVAAHYGSVAAFLTALRWLQAKPLLPATESSVPEKMEDKQFEKIATVVIHWECQAQRLRFDPSLALSFGDGRNGIDGDKVVFWLDTFARSLTPGEQRDGFEIFEAAGQASRLSYWKGSEEMEYRPRVWYQHCGTGSFLDFGDLGMDVALDEVTARAPQERLLVVPGMVVRLEIKVGGRRGLIHERLLCATTLLYCREQGLCGVSDEDLSLRQLSFEYMDSHCACFHIAGYSLLRPALQRDCPWTHPDVAGLCIHVHDLCSSDNTSSSRWQSGIVIDHLSLLVPNPLWAFIEVDFR